MEVGAGRCGPVSQATHSVIAAVLGPEQRGWTDGGGPKRLLAAGQGGAGQWRAGGATVGQIRFFPFERRNSQYRGSRSFGGRVTSNPDRELVTGEQAAVIGGWLSECELSWLICETPGGAGVLEKRLRAAYLPSLNRV